MKFEELKLPPGYPLQLQTSSAEGVARKINCRYVGAVPGRYVLLSPPKNLRLRSGQKLAVKAMIANGIAMFSATVESLIAVPDPMLCVSFPSNVAMKEIRGATRVAVDLAVTAENKSALEARQIEGKISDISTTGAKLELTDAIADVGEQVSIEAQVGVGDIVRALNIVATIRARIDRSTKELDEKYSAIYGVEFGNLDDENYLLLHAYVNGEMARG